MELDAQIVVLRIIHSNRNGNQ